jgi:glucuronide carrier protein
MTTAAAPPAEPRRLGLSQYLGYAAGDAANNLAFSMTSLFLLLYYTDVVGLSAAAIGTMFLVVRFWDAFADLSAGRLVDSAPSTRWGKFRPFLLFGALPLLLISVATFSVPGSLSDDGKLVYAYVTYALLGLLYSLVNIPYGSLAASMTQVPTERAKLASFRVIGSNVTILMLALVVAPQIKNSGDLQHSLTITTLTFVAVGFVLYLWTFLTAREQVQRDVAKVSVRQSLGTLRHNRPLLLLCLSGLMYLTALTGLSTVGAFYARDVLGDANLFIVLTLVQTAGVFLAAPFVPRLTRTVGKKYSFIGFGVVGIVGFVGLTLAPASMPAVAIVMYGVVGVGLGGVNTLMWAMEADTVEYGEWKMGVRTEGTTYATFSFTRKMGQAFGGAAAAYTIGFGGYVSGKGVVQSDSAISAIKLAAGVVPAAFVLISVAVMAIYPLTEARFRELVQETAQRRVAREATAMAQPVPKVLPPAQSGISPPTGAPL